MKFIIEHLEPKVYEWCVLEYTHISEMVGKESLIITNVKKNGKALEKIGTVYSESVKELGIFKKTCLLDPSAPTELSARDAKEFEHFVFGGILGDYPMRLRTRELLPAKHFDGIRNLGTHQFSTDTAVFVTKKMLEGKKLSDLTFIDDIEIPMGEGESIVLPFRYIVINGKPMIPDGIVDLLKKKKGF